MHSYIDPDAQKDTFLAENEFFTEVELGNESKPIGRIEDIDVSENELWLLQCPKGMDVKRLENQKLKIPGRTNHLNSEAVSVEFIDGIEQHPFAYCNRMGKYALRLLPFRGTIVLRNRLKAAETITTERIEECCPPSKRVPMPSTLRVRHPLLGFRYEEKLILKNELADRLNEADQVSAKIIRKSLVKKITETPKKSKVERDNSTPIEIDSEEVEDDVIKHKKSRRGDNEDRLEKKKKHKKSKKNYEGKVSKDLQWIVDI